MSRCHLADITEVWRAVIVHTWPDGRRTERYDGPYVGKRQASAAITRARRLGSWYYDDPAEVTGSVERGAVTWEAR